LKVIALLAFLFTGPAIFAQQGQLTTRAAGNSAQEPATKQKAPAEEDSQQLRDEVHRLRAEVEALRAIVERSERERQSKAAQPSKTINTAAEMPGIATNDLQQPAQSKTPSQTNAEKKIAVATKSQGGDLSGAGNLLRTDRITMGGYGDFQFRGSSVSERADGGGTPTFQNTRLVLGIAAVLAEKQNIVFNSEIEYEFGSRELDVEQAYVEWKMRPQFAFRGGIFVPAIGRFNVYHDSYLNLTAIRPLINQFIIPTAYRDAGIGVRGRFKLPRKMKLTYEADLLNGMQGTNADGEPTPFSRLLGQSSAAEPGQIAFQAENRRKAIAGRVGLSPIAGLEFGVSGYNGRFNKLADPPQSATIIFVDGSYHRGELTINGEYGRSNIVGGISRKSPAPPIVDPNDPSTITALALFVGERTPGQDGFYIEGTYRFAAPFAVKKLDDSAYVAPVLRYEVVRLDRTIPNFYLNRSRTTLGFNLAPSASVIFKLNYLFNHTFGPVPKVPAGVGGAVFGVSPLPHVDYGRNGFTGSIAYVF
jgi:hypothetical protein